MLGVPSNINYTQIVDDLLKLPGVRNAHSLHIWSLSLQKTALSVHIAIGMSYLFLNIVMFDDNNVCLDDDQDYLTVLNDVQEMVRRKYSITRATIQIEAYDEQIMNSCENCRRPGT